MLGRGWWGIGQTFTLCALLGFYSTNGAAESDSRRAALMAEAELLMTQAPEVDPLAEWGGKIGPAEAGRRIAGLLAEAGQFANAERMAVGIAGSGFRNSALGDVAILLALDGQLLRAFKLLDGIDDAKQSADALIGVLRRPRATDKFALILMEAEERSAALKAVKRVATLAGRLSD